MQVSDFLGLSVANHTASQFNGGKLQIYKGVQPASPQVAPSASDLMVEIDLPGTVFSNATIVSDKAVASLAATIVAVDIAIAGVATWARGSDSGGNALQDLVVGSDVTLSETNLGLSDSVSVTGWVIRIPLL